MMRTFSELFTCEHCDSVYRRISPGRGDVARCARCDAVLHRGSQLGIDPWLACAVAAAVMFVIANTSPAVRVGLEGMANESTISQAIVALARGPETIMAVVAALTVIVIPALQIGLLVWLLAFARAGRRAPGFAHGIRLLDMMRPWSMVEVSMVGVLVTMVKLSANLKVVPLTGAWALMILMGLLTLIGSRDIRSLWDLTEPRFPS